MKNSLVLLAALVSLPAIAHADSFPFGSASAYNIVALGSVNSMGATTLVGNVSTSADVTGRIAASGSVTVGTTVGSDLGSDPYGTSTLDAIVCAKGLASGQTFNIDGGGSVYAPNTAATVNFNDGGSLTTSGTSPLNFTSLRVQMDEESTELAGLSINGQNLGTGNAAFGNPSFYVLQGTSTTLNVFRIDNSLLSNANNPIDIVVPAGSTVVINVLGNSATFATNIYINGVLYSGNSTAGSNIVFNFRNATAVTVDSQLNASILAPYAVLTGTAQMAGQFIAAQVGQTGEVENVEFTGNLSGTTTTMVSVATVVAPTPEPTSLALLGTGVLGIAGMVRRKKIQTAE